MVTPAGTKYAAVETEIEYGNFHANHKQNSREPLHECV